MLDELNKIRNSNFAAGGPKPTSWLWHNNDGEAAWQPVPTSGNGDLAGVEIRAHKHRAAAIWAQSFRPKKEQNYRIEAVVSCDCEPAPGNTEGGLSLTLQPFDADGTPRAAVSTPALHKAHEYTIRAYYETPPDTRRIELRIGLTNAVGSAAIHDVRVIPVLEVDAKSHPWAIPAIPYAQPAPMRVRKVCVVTDRPDRPVVELLRARFGQGAVQTCSSRGFRSASRDADAVVFADARPPASCRSVAALRTLARKRIVVVSLQAMEVISGGRLVTRAIRQIDDPLHARIRYADYATNGFALYDIIPFAYRADHSTAMTQRQFRVNEPFRNFCSSNKLDVLIESEADSDATSRKPVALFGRTDGGAIVVMDVEPAESIGSSLDEPALAAHLLIASLGATRVTLGQYSAVARNAEEFDSHVRDVVDRFPELSHAAGSPPEQPESPYLVTVGRDLDTIGLPLVPRPMLLIRTCLRGDDLIGAYGVMLWLKHLLRKAPFDSPYAKTLASALRIAWMPLSGPMTTWGGWRATGDPKPFPLEIDFDPGSIAAMIDITTWRGDHANILTPKRDRFLADLSDMLPPILPSVASAGSLRRSGVVTPDQAGAWCSDTPDINITVSSDSFRQPIHRAASDAGGRLVRLEVPGSHSAPMAHSIWQTEWIAHTLEQLAGLLVGAIVVNRLDKPMTLRCPETIRRTLARATLRPFGQPDRQKPAPKLAGDKLTVPPAHAVVAANGR